LPFFSSIFPSISSAIFTPIFSSRRLLASLGISFLLAATGLGFLARRHGGMPGVQQAAVATEATGTSTAEPPKQMSVVQRLLAESASQASEEQANMPAASSAEDNARRTTSEAHDSASRPRTTRPRAAAGRVVAATRQPEVSGAVLSATPAAEQVSGTPAGAVADSNLQIRIESRFGDATLSVWIDNRLAYQHPLRDGRKKRLILLGGGPKQTITIPLAAGQHELRVGVQSAAEQYDESRTVAGEFLKDGEKILSITFEKRSKTMRVSLQ